MTVQYGGILKYWSIIFLYLLFDWTTYERNTEYYEVLKNVISTINRGMVGGGWIPGIQWNTSHTQSNSKIIN